MKKLLLALLAALLPLLASAAGGVATLTWTAPTQYVNGLTLAPSEIAFYTITYTVGANSQSSVQVAGNLTTTTVNVVCGSTTFMISVTTTGTASFPNATSGESAQVPYATGIACVPQAPTNLKAS